MVKVYILSDVLHFDSSEILGVFDNLEKAQAKALDVLKESQGAHRDKTHLRWEHGESLGAKWWRHKHAAFSTFLIEEFEVQ